MAFLGVDAFGAGSMIIGGNVVVLESPVSQDTISNMYSIVGTLQDAGVSIDTIMQIAVMLPAILDSGIGTDTITALLATIGITDLSAGIDSIDILKFFNILKMLAKMKTDLNMNSKIL